MDIFLTTKESQELKEAIKKEIEEKLIKIKTKEMEQRNE